MGSLSSSELALKPQGLISLRMGYFDQRKASPNSPACDEHDRASLLPSFYHNAECTARAECGTGPGAAEAADGLLLQTQTSPAEPAASSSLSNCA